MNYYAYQVNFTTQKQRKLLVKALLALGFADRDTRLFKEDGYHFIVSEDFQHITGDSRADFVCQHGGEVISLDRLLQLMANKTQPIEVILSDEHTAIISSGGIQVGCTHIPFAIYDKVEEAVKKVRS